MKLKVLDLSSKCDLYPLRIPIWSALNLQDIASPSIFHLTKFHDFAITIITIITILVGLNLFFTYYFKFTDRYLIENQTIELIWTIMPVFILIIIAIPSLTTLYMLDDPLKPNLTIKTIGHQWYWSYEYSDFPNIEFDSYIKPTEDLSLIDTRLLETDNNLIIPIKTQIRIITTGADVIHSWTVPALGVKADAVPGRLNQIIFLVDRPGLYYGQCSEICGSNHSFIPIKIEATPINTFLNWVTNYS